MHFFIDSGIKHISWYEWVNETEKQSLELLMLVIDQYLFIFHHRNLIASNKDLGDNIIYITIKSKRAPGLRRVMILYVLFCYIQ